MSCSNSIPPLPDFECSFRAPKVSQEDLRRTYNLPGTAFDISLAYHPPKVIRMPFGMMEAPADYVLSYRVGMTQRVERVKYGPY
jgi:hypothetical protein